MRPLTISQADKKILALQQEIQRSEESRYDHRLHAVLLVAHGMTEAIDANPDFYVAFYVGLKDRYDVGSVGYGWPVIHRHGWYGWPAGYDAWAVPYTESTLIVDVIDARTNQLVWRGYDSDTLNLKDPDKTLGKAVDSVLARFYHDAKHEITGDRGRLG